MDRGCLATRGSKPDAVCINRGCVKAISAQNRYIDIFRAARVYLVSIALGPNVNGNQHSSLKFNRANVACSYAGEGKLIALWAGFGVGRIDGAANREQRIVARTRNQYIFSILRQAGITRKVRQLEVDTAVSQIANDIIAERCS